MKINVKAIRKMVNSNKGFITFWLILFFLNAGFAKSITSNAAIGFDKTGTEHHNTGSKHDLTAISDDDSESGFLYQIKKGLDTDDLDLAFFGNYSSKSVTYFQRQHQFADGGIRPEIYGNSLYDLYCNWKFHLA